MAGVEGAQVPMENTERSERMKTGWWVFLGLAVVTAIEIWLGSSVQGTLGYLTVTSLVKAGLIVYYFMHVTQAWHGKGERE
jgi:cytochrome c oxidase subunit IV